MRILQNILEVLGNLKHKGPSKIYCPRCGSSSIRLSSTLDYWLTPRKYVCEKCGYTGPIIMELEEESKDESGG
jgi:predicted RNA-binding Zn-ribbon protein involved in translation (DUF1610 family)